MHGPELQLIGDSPHECTMRFLDEHGNYYERNFFAPSNGGYVRENYHQPRQVCEGLRRLGNTLWWDPKYDKTLSALIRRESRRDWAAANRALGIEPPRQVRGRAVSDF